MNDAPESKLDMSRVHEVYAGSEGATTGMSGDAFIPESSPEGQTPEYLPPYNNLAANKDLVAKALATVRKYYTRYQADRQDMETLWKDCDYMWKCAKNASKRKSKTNKNDANNESTTHASTGSTLFYRQVTLLSAQTLSIYLAKEDPYRYVPVFSRGAFLKEDEGRAQADQLNGLSRWTRSADDFEQKYINGSTILNKYGNVPVCIGWKRKIQKRMEKIPIRGEAMDPGKPPPVVGYEFVTREVEIENFPSLMFGQIENFYADMHIGEMQKQNCVLYQTTANYCDIYSGARNGEYTNTDQVTDAHLWKGQIDSDVHDARMENRGLAAGDDTQTGLFLQWDVHVRLPISEAGEWDEKQNEPVLFRLTFFGDIKGNAVCARFIRNDDPDDEIPWIMWHQFPDDPDNLYHLSGAEIVASTYDELTTAKNQAIDNRTLQNRKPLKAVRGAVFNRDLRFGQHKIFWVEAPDSIGEFTVSDITGTIQTNINYLESEANRALATDRPIEGQPLGGRTSASEAQNVFEQARMPHMLNARYQMGQLLTWYARKSQRYWMLYAAPNQIVEITGESEKREIRPAQLWGDYEVIVDVVNDAQDNAMRQQSLNYAIQTFLQIPQFAEAIEPQEFLKEWFEMNRWRGASRFLKRPQDFDTARVARWENDIMAMSENPQYIAPEEQQNHAQHLKEHRSFRAQFDNIENAHEMYPGLIFLDQHIAETEFIEKMQMQAQAGMAPPMAGPMNQSVGEVSGNQMAGMMGASRGF